MTGARESKKEATRARIAEAGLRLFREHGYDATTLDDIAAAAGISRRTFFYYFKSKDDVLLAWHGAGALSSALHPAMLEQSPEQTPLEAAMRCLLSLASRYETAESKAMDALMRSSDALSGRKDIAEIQMERDLADAMSTLWPDPAQRTHLRIAAMMAIGTLRLSLDDWRNDTSDTPLAHHLDRNFRTLMPSASDGE
ncbi:helix-turn-helix domain-containing protein [Streptomyces sp. NPDC004959]|uniref:TetR/AcrR family transcriptional regulator n=1 Tax=unclassified Streptomyces TaxID=2593676 RepID=UPI00068F610F|nr:TetR/AcrR family transcriptional regulator [Streptomyces sp. NRRL F-5630]